jgi:hypothetical protein
LNDKKIITNKKYNFALNGCQGMTVNATTNQKMTEVRGEEV